MELDLFRVKGFTFGCCSDPLRLLRFFLGALLWHLHKEHFILELGFLKKAFSHIIIRKSDWFINTFHSSMFVYIHNSSFPFLLSFSSIYGGISKSVLNVFMHSNFHTLKHIYFSYTCIHIIGTFKVSCIQIY